MTQNRNAAVTTLTSVRPDSPPPGLATVEAAIAAIAAGEMVVVVDSPDRENEGDLVMAAQHVTPEAVNFMATEARGLVCVSLTAERLRELDIPPMVAKSSDPLRTAFHVSVDHRTLASTGISAQDRAATIRALVGDGATSDTFTQPGHVFPLASKPGGVLERAGHTEAAMDLATLAGCAPAGVICEIANEDGEMARLPDLLVFARTHGLLVLAISDLIKYQLEERRREEQHEAGRQTVTRTGQAQIPLAAGTFTAIGYVSHRDNLEHIAMVYGDVAREDAPLVRVHSECMTGDLFGSQRCDCGLQLDLAMRQIVSEGAGVLVYLRGHEGRGIGLGEKLRAYQLQERGLDTVEANLALGHPVDARDYGDGAGILRDLGISAIRLMTNNPRKQAGLEQYGTVVTERVPLVTTPGRHNAGYLQTKQVKMGHRLTRVPDLTVLDESFAVF